MSATLDNDINTQTTSPVPTLHPTSATRYLGICKWFDKMKGFGFIHGLDDDSQDFFVHHTQVGRTAAPGLDTDEDKSGTVDENVFRYLIAGEYVEFCIHDKPRTDAPVSEVGNPTDTDTDTDATSTSKSPNRVMATFITGPRGGPLMYQTYIQQQEELNAKYGAHNPDHRNTQEAGDFTTITHRRHTSGRGKGKGKGKGKGRHSGKGRHHHNRWSEDNGYVQQGSTGAAYYGHVPLHATYPQVGYCGGQYYGHAPPNVYGQGPPNIGYSAQPPPSKLPQSSVQHPNGFAALEE